VAAEWQPERSKHYKPASCPQTHGHGPYVVPYMRPQSGLPELGIDDQQALAQQSSIRLAKSVECLVFDQRSLKVRRLKKLRRSRSITSTPQDAEWFKDDFDRADVDQYRPVAILTSS